MIQESEFSLCELKRLASRFSDDLFIISMTLLAFSDALSDSLEVIKIVSPFSP